jgi:hypothetical protein
MPLARRFTRRASFSFIRDELFIVWEKNMVALPLSIKSDRNLASSTALSKTGLAIGMSSIGRTNLT